ncbi:MAG: Chain length determinant protein, partial [Flavipsychrobacter sp.]|nr:Chain length determinant protein [Flavipsychrobacter sp.]
MTTPRFDLVDIIQTIRQRRKFILIVTILTVLVGVLFTFVRKNKYKAEAEFFLSNPLYADRNYLFRSHDMHFVDFFAGDDDIDKIIVTAES